MAYVLPPLDENMRAAMGDTAFSLGPSLVFESAMPALYVSELMGMRVESGIATPRVKSGEIFNTAKGDFVLVEYSTVNSAGEVVTAEAVQVDVGQGVEQLQTVIAAEPVADFAGAEEVVAAPEQPFYSESAVSTNPFETQAVEYYVHPEVPQADVVEFTVGSSAPVQTTTGFDYYSSGTASATQDLIGYGELDVNGNPIQTVQTTDPSNYDAQYDGV